MAQRQERHIQPSSGPERAFGEAVREIRQKRKLSQEQLGFESGFDRTYISLLERGIQSPTIRTVVRLAEVLKVSPSFMIRKMERALAKKQK